MTHIAGRQVRRGAECKPTARAEQGRRRQLEYYYVCVKARWSVRSSACRVTPRALGVCVLSMFPSLFGTVRRVNDDSGRVCSRLAW